MKVLSFAGSATALAALMLPVPGATQGLVRGPDPMAAPAAAPQRKTEWPKVEVVRLPSGQQMKRLASGDEPPASAVAPVAAQQVGHVMVRVLGTGHAPAPVVATTATGAAARQLGHVQLLEHPGWPTPGLPASPAASTPLAGLVIVDLAEGQSPPTPPAPNTLYRRAVAAH